MSVGEKKAAGDQRKERGELQDVFAKLHRKTAAHEAGRASEPAEPELAEEVSGKSKYMSVCLSVHLSFCPSIYLLLVSLYPTTCLSVCLCIICLSVCLSARLLSVQEFLMKEL